MSTNVSQRDTKFLLCSICKEYLSCGPVFIRKEKFSVCGRCFVSGERGIRNRYYEIAAKNLRFPCKYRSIGCPEQQCFAESYIYSHEYSCEYRIFNCMLWDEDEDECHWQNLKAKLVEHCLTKHPEKYLNNCCTLQLALDYTNHRTYLLSAFEMVFLVYIKVLVSASDSKIEFRLEFLGKQQAAPQFQYALNIKKDRSLITKTGDCKSDPIFNEVGIDLLKDIFNGLHEVTFHITITVTCVCCKKDLLYGQLYNKGPYWYCSQCTPHSKACENQIRGCTYKDNPYKLTKHEEYFCKYSTNFEGINILQYGKIWKVIKSDDKCAFTTDIGLVLCIFTAVRTDGKIEILLYSPLRSDQGCDFICQVIVRNPLTGESKIFNPQFLGYCGYDWYIDIKRDENPSWGPEIAIYVIVQRRRINPQTEEY